MHSALFDRRKLSAVFPVQAPTPVTGTPWWAFNFSTYDVGEVAGGFYSGSHEAGGDVGTLSLCRLPPEEAEITVFLPNS